MTSVICFSKQAVAMAEACKYWSSAEPQPIIRHYSRALKPIISSALSVDCHSFSFQHSSPHEAVWSDLAIRIGNEAQANLKL
jgi:hypothetical protein